MYPNENYTAAFCIFSTSTRRLLQRGSLTADEIVRGEIGRAFIECGLLLVRRR